MTQTTSVRGAVALSLAIALVVFTHAQSPSSDVQVVPQIAAQPNGDQALGAPVQTWTSPVITIARP